MRQGFDLAKLDKPEKCRACGAPIVFIPTDTGGIMPVDVKPEMRVIVLGYPPAVAPSDVGKKDGERRDFIGYFARVTKAFVSHFATCPNAGEFRGKH